ncbi:MAG TPA: bifunctional 2-polyprenyl-6-hydroxyphenol methylase/3-demethylubiquinol 3-O-methyltransferase UbiG, partial [Polyangiaceae bacterium]|jgi:2-polyprenyl-6-hydroxyphenyl methylase/3-demethylubiquinone-9 3-methyltransferase|nr:bifunctional 2-polyprenyl-6-hydroxyphenol methylase/3-demethylubiquinol 3-O-methyltransferase UbiG [Polyangiaceae bacterium]
MEANAHSPAPAVNNEIYSTLGDRWYDADDDPVALLRAESRFRNPWVTSELAGRFSGRACTVLDVGCGAGFLTNHLASHGHAVTGLDMADDGLRVARAHDATGKVDYRSGDALALPFGAGAFDVVCAMDVLEHVEDPARLVAEAGRVLTPGGLFFFHTFDRNFLSWLVVIKGVEWFVKNTPPDMHVLRLFVTPGEVMDACRRAGLSVTEIFGTRPRVDGAFFRMLRTGVVSPDFAFTRSRSTRLGYTGFARKTAA